MRCGGFPLNRRKAENTSLGGTRPKASVRAPDGHLLVAKFPRVDHDWPVTRWEAATMTLAQAAGGRSRAVAAAGGERTEQSSRHAVSTGATAGASPTRQRSLRSTPPTTRRAATSRLPNSCGAKAHG